MSRSESRLQCRLLGGPVAWLAQGLLGFLAVLALLYKRHHERPQRPLEIWGMDVTKQMLSMLIAHIFGILIAMAASDTSGRDVSECAWYFVAFAFDTSLGVALAIAGHSLAVQFAKMYASSSTIAADISECGSYGNPPQWKRFWAQALEWTLAVILARLLCGLVVLALKTGLVHVARLLDWAFAGRPIALLFFVMICCPLLMNLLQALIQDMALKWRKSHHGGAGSLVLSTECEAERLGSPPFSKRTSWSP